MTTLALRTLSGTIDDAQRRYVIIISGLDITCIGSVGRPERGKVLKRQFKEGLGVKRLDGK